MPQIKVAITFTQSELETVRAAANKSLVRDVLNDLREHLNPESNKTATLTRRPNTELSATDIDAALDDLRHRRENMEALPQTEKRDEALGIYDEAIRVLQSTRQEIDSTLSSENARLNTGE